MTTRTEKAASRIAEGVGRGSKAAAGATRRLSDTLERVAAASERFSSPRKVHKARRALAAAAKAAAVAAVVVGVHRATKVTRERVRALEAQRKRKNRIKTAAKVAGVATAVAGAVILARRARNK